MPKKRRNYGPIKPGASYERWYRGQVKRELAAARRAETARRKAAGTWDMRTKKAKSHWRSSNPKQLLFRTAKAARAYAKAHGAKRFSIRKLKKGR